MKVNFDIKDNHAIEIAGRHIDLHNNFDFVGFDYNLADREIKLHWKKSNGDWIDKNEFSSLVLTHKGVTFLRVIEKDEKSINEDDSCLGEITFFPSTEREKNDSIVSQSKPNDGDDIIYMFENGQRIRIHCEQIELKIYKDTNLNLTVTKDEALVLFEFLARFNQAEHPEIFEDQAEQKTLWILEGQLEKQLVEPFRPNYQDIINEARNQIRDEE
ncbi:hypothetical protein [Flavobacterium sp.]|jgi:hypothetical protein|uniref:hypothetical protein n=1 Tax=Flavobacterium sp. TaxID=239 RepID=UPI0037C0DEB5